MRILVFSLGVVFKYGVQGGSQKVLRDISIGMSHRGHEITIMCPKREDNHEIFELCHRVIVKPILPLHGAFPMPYDVSPFSLLETYRLLEEEIRKTDILYCHDGGLLIEGLKMYVPTVISLRDFCYQETLLGALNFNGSSVVVNSIHTSLCLQDSFVRINPSLKGKIKLIYNGYDANIFCKKIVTEIFCSKYSLPRKTNELIIGFPHRPEMSKGFSNALQVLRYLSNVFGERVKLMIPLYMDRGISSRTDETYYHTKTMIEDFHLQRNVIYHNWIYHEDMPEYYSYCDVILCIGNFVESFSNVSVESLLCETPVVASSAATYRTMPIHKFLNIVPYGANDEVARVVQKLLMEKQSRFLKEARAFISKELSVEKMVYEYEQVFLEAMKEKKISIKDESHMEKSTKSISNVKYKLAAWCVEIDDMIYDDYRGEYVEDSFKGLFLESNERYTRRELILRGIDEDIIDNAIVKGFIVECR